MPTDLTAYLRKRGSPLADHVPALMRAANRHRIDPRLLVAISGGETSFGTNGRGPKVYNAWGVGPGRAYSSWEDGLDSVAELLRKSYVGKGLTSLSAIQQKWAPVGAGNDPSNLNSNWIRTIGQFYSDLGGDPRNVTKNWRVASAPKNFQPPGKAPRLAPPVQQAGFGDLVAQQAMANLTAIAQGKTPSLEGLVQASVQQTLDDALASKAPDVVPEKEQVPTPDGGKFWHTGTTERADDPRVQTAVQLALRQIGKPYVWGSAGPKSFDCSGLIEWAYEQAGIKTPGRLTTYSMRNVGHSVKGGPMQPGDWIITNGGKHVVMYIGGGEVVAAPHSGTNVQIQKLSDHKKGIVDVRRYR
jgi:cell wall-associated NlpC family hydrolase